MTQDEKIAQLKEALMIASKALSIAADWNVSDVQVNPPKNWNLESYNEDPKNGWCSTRALSNKLRMLAS